MDGGMGEHAVHGRAPAPSGIIKKHYPEAAVTASAPADSEHACMTHLRHARTLPGDSLSDILEQYLAASSLHALAV
jgi:hypothetical protein